MSLYIDRKYIERIKIQLDGFSWVRENLANCRCIICGDSRSNKSKRRMYFYKSPIDEIFMVKCHNCGYSNPVGLFFKEVDELVYNEYNLERYADRASYIRKPREKGIDFSISRRNNAKVLFKGVPSHAKALLLLDDSHIAKQQIMARNVSKEFLRELWYTDNFRALCKEVVTDKSDEEIEKIPDDKRVVIPFYDEDNNLIVVQGRSISDSGLRYVTIKTHEDNTKIYGMNKVNKSSPIYVLEGAFDASFIPNSIATNDSNLLNAANYYDNIILIPDNEYRNPELKRQIEKFIDSGIPIVLFPKSVSGKDINKMIIDGTVTRAELMNLILTNTFKGLQAKVRFSSL